MSAAESTLLFGVENAAEFSNRSTRSPSIAPDVPRPTRTVVPVAASVALSQPSPSFAEPCSIGALGDVAAAVSFTKASGAPVTPGLPAASITRAVSDFGLSAPISAGVTVKLT